MAYYGIPSAGIALTAGSDNDQIGVIGHGATTLTAQTIFGGEAMTSSTSVLLVLLRA